MKHDLLDFLFRISREMEEEYFRIQNRTKDDPGTAGDQGEENWATLLREWLPSNYHIVTKGRIIGVNGDSSPQVDILVLHPFYPKKLLDKKHYLSAGVVAAFECKIKLKKSHLKKIVETSKAIRELVWKSKDNYKAELYSPILYGVLAHTTDINATKESSREENLMKVLIENEFKILSHPIQHVDFLCVSNSCFIWTYKMPIYYDYGEKKFENTPATKYSVTDLGEFSSDKFIENRFPAISFLLAWLYFRLNPKDFAALNFGHYFKLVLGMSATGSIRTWPENTLSEELRKTLENPTDEMINEIYNDPYDFFCLPNFLRD